MEPALESYGDALESLPIEDTTKLEAPSQLSTISPKMADAADAGNEQMLKIVEKKASKRGQERHSFESDVTCPITGSSHSNLLQFDIDICPKCHAHIQGDDEGGPTQKNISLARKAIAEINTLLVTNHRPSRSRTKTERERIARAGFLRNRGVEFKFITQCVTLRSKPLINVLQNMVKYYPGINLTADTVESTYPFFFLAHSLPELERFQNSFQQKGDLAATTNRQESTTVVPHSQTQLPIEGHMEVAFDHVKKLVFWMKNKLYGQKLDDELARHLQSPPGEGGKASAYIVEGLKIHASGAAVRLNGDVERLLPYNINLWNLSFDGQYVRRSKITVMIASFDDRGSTREELIQRGRKWYGMLTGAQQWHYSGQSRSSDRKMIDRRVVIDIGSYLRHENIPLQNQGPSPPPQNQGFGPPHPQNQRSGPSPQSQGQFPWAEYDLINPEDDDLELSADYSDRQHRILLCSNQLMGFALKSRTWEMLDVENCQPPNINTKAIDTLVMPEERKRMIKAIVQKTSPTNFGNRPLAKFISELIERPLLALTGADFGTNEEMMENRLSSWFQLAESWGAVMLLDEADVWLERRMVSDLKRNTLVAVFLRCLEYYRGILFLTTNRVGTFDDAFISRIHVVIYYEDLGELQRRRIWKQFFDKLEKERKDTIIVESRAKHFVINDSEMKKIPWNGREIRNAFQTAVSLAEYRFHHESEKEEGNMIVLDKVDFEQVCQMSVDFKQYLKMVHRGDDEIDRAMRERLRA
ncbi:ATPase [Whalleya microplaca]|nr:ATPase [Whalleya microplaca]